MHLPRLATAFTVAAVAVAGLATPAAALAAEASHPRCTTAPSEPTTLPPLSADKLRAVIDTVPNDDVTGAIVQIRGSAGCWEGTSGVADLRTQRPVPQNGRFRIGSMTKTFTAAVALQLVAEERLALDRTVQHYLPDLLPSSYPPITVRQVLNYTSGVNGVGVPHKTPEWFFAHRYDTWAPGSQLDLSVPLAFAPGTKQRYGNADHILAGLLIEGVTGNTWEHEVTDRIIRPLRLRGTVASGTDRKIHGPHAHGYEAEATAEGGTRWRDVTEANPSLQWSAAAIISTAHDLDRFLFALFQGKVVPSAQLTAMFDVPKVPAYDGDTNPTNDKAAQHAAGLSRLGGGVWGKAGDRPGYNNGMGSTRDGSRRLVYSVNTTSMGGVLPEVADQIATATFRG